MKRILAIILILMMILPLVVSCNKDQEDANGSQTKDPATNSSNNSSSDNTVEVAKLAGKTPKEMYDATISALAAMSEYEVVLKESTSVNLLDEPTVSTNTDEYRVKNGTAYIKYTSPTEKISEIWFKEGMIYTSSNGEKQRTKITAEAFASTYLLNISTVIFPLEDSYFKDIKFVKSGDVYELRIPVTKEDYLKYLNVTISDSASYVITFDSKGVIKSAVMKAVCPASSGVNIDLETEVKFNKLGEADDINIAGKIADYRLAPALDEIDMSTVDSLEKFVASDKQTDYVMLDVQGMGKIVIRLFPDVAPTTVANFKELVSKGFYNGLIFHRVEKDFVIQGGDTDGDGISNDDDTKIRGEFASNGFFNNLSHVSGVVSMARTSNDMNSASTQFFIMHTDKYIDSVDGKYAAFGYVVCGMDVVDAIANVEVDKDTSKPLTDVVITSATFVKLEK